MDLVQQIGGKRIAAPAAGATDVSNIDYMKVTERYRALLAEVHDQLLDAPAIAQRRDALVEEARACFEHAPPADRQTYDIARKALSGTGRSGYSEDEIDALLPASLRRPKSVQA